MYKGKWMPPTAAKGILSNIRYFIKYCPHNIELYLYDYGSSPVKQNLEQITHFATLNDVHSFLIVAILLLIMLLDKS